MLITTEKQQDSIPKKYQLPLTKYGNVEPKAALLRKWIVAPDRRSKFRRLVEQACKEKIRK